MQLDAMSPIASASKVIFHRLVFTNIKVDAIKKCIQVHPLHQMAVGRVVTGFFGFNHGRSGCAEHYFDDWMQWMHSPKGVHPASIGVFEVENERKRDRKILGGCGGEIGWRMLEVERSFGRAGPDSVVEWWPSYFCGGEDGWWPVI